MSELIDSNNQQLSRFKEIAELAVLLKDAGDLIPERYRGNVGAIAAVIAAGDEIGFPPMVSLRSIYLVYGMIGLSYSAIVGLLRKNHYSIKWKETTEKIATVILTHPDGTEFLFSFTIEDARKLGLLNRKNKKGEKVFTGWDSQPKTMLRARCISTAARSFAGEIFIGVYLIEELEDFKHKTYEHDVSQEKTGKEKLLSVLKEKSNSQSQEIEAQQDAPAIEKEEPLFIPQFNQTSNDNLEPVYSPNDFAVSINQPVEKLTVLDFKAMITGAQTKHDLRMVSSKITLCKNITEEEKITLRGLYSDKSKDIGVGHE